LPNENLTVVRNLNSRNATMLFEQETCEKSLSSDEEKVDDGI
jgi:hypothetical protein